MKKSHTSDRPTFRCAFIHRYVLISIIVMYLFLFVPLLQNCCAQIDHAFTRAHISGFINENSGFFSSTSYVSESLLTPDLTQTAWAISVGNQPPATPHFHLRGLSEVIRINPATTIWGNLVSHSRSRWIDEFTVSGANLPSQLRFYYSLTGRIQFERLGEEFGAQWGSALAFISAPNVAHTGYVVSSIGSTGDPTFSIFNMDVNVLPPGDDGFYGIIGTSFFDVPVNSLTGRGTLFVEMIINAESGGAVNTTANFMNTFGYTAITLTDGTPLSEAGLTIQFDSVVAVPEPSALFLILAVSVVLLCRRARTLFVISKHATFQSTNQ